MLFHVTKSGTHAVEYVHVQDCGGYVGTQALSLQNPQTINPKPITLTLNSKPKLL